MIRKYLYRMKNILQLKCFHVMIVLQSWHDTVDTLDIQLQMYTYEAIIYMGRGGICRKAGWGAQSSQWSLCLRTVAVGSI